MRKVFLVLIILFLGVSCNQQKAITQNTPTSTQSLSNQPVLGSNKKSIPDTNQFVNSKTYNGSGITFQYPSAWAISAVGVPSKNPTSCGDGWGNAVSCISLDPPELAKMGTNTIFILVLNTNLSSLNWCHSFSDRLNNCQISTINGYDGAVATSSSGDYPTIQYRIVSHKGILVVFQSSYSDYILQFNSIVNSIKFSK